MKKLSTFFTIASGAFALVPGLTVLISNIGVPPNSSQALFGGIIEALGVVALMLLWLNKEWIRHTRLNTINRLIIYLTILFLISLFSYIFLYKYLVIGVHDSATVFFPLWATGELKDGIAQFGNRMELIEQWGKDDVVRVIESSSMIPLLITTLIMLFIYQLTFVSLTIAFGLLGIKGSDEAMEENDEDSNKNST